MESNAAKSQVYRARPTGGAQRSRSSEAAVIGRKQPKAKKALPPLRLKINKLAG